MDTMAAIKQTFFEECEEQLAELETGLLALAEGEHDPETVNAVFRAVHSIKGGAGAFNLSALVHFAHSFESTLDLVRTGKLLPAPDVMKVLLRAADVLSDFVRAARDGADLDPNRGEALVVELRGLVERTVGVRVAGADEPIEFVPVAVDLSDFAELAFEPATTFRIVFRPSRDLYAKGNDAVILLRELARLGDMRVSCDATELPPLSALDADNAYLTWSVTLTTTRREDEVRDIFDFVEWDCTLQIDRIEDKAPSDDVPEPSPRPADPAQSDPVVEKAPHDTAPMALAAQAAPMAEDAGSGDHAGGERKAASVAIATIRVDLERVDRLIDLVGELVINQAMLAERVTEAGLARVSAVAIGLDELEQLTREIQDSVMAIRAQPVKSVFQRMPRLAREVAAQTGKSIRLITEGEATEVDKTVIERLSDPLTHMIRNAIDHGVEHPDVRSANGKPEEGTVKLSALHRSGRIVIEVSDDGAGIDRERVKQIATDKKLIPADAKLSDDEIDNLIFLPGFSTAEVVSDISGRGVGMDVVRRSIQSLGGRIAISSRPGRGSTFTMSLPLTLAVLDGMVVTVSGQTLVIPLTAVIETLLPKPSMVHAFGGGERVIAVRNGYLPLIDVGQVLQYRTEPADPRSGIVLLVEAEGRVRCALLVDAILGQRQVVIKSLELNYGHVPGIAAATILGDGRVALILDVDAVVASSRSSEPSIFDPSCALTG